MSARLLLLLGILIAPIGSAGADEFRVLDRTGEPRALSAIVQELLVHRAIFIGETHDRYDNHLAQLAVIRALHQVQPEGWAIGVEFFQQSFQQPLDAYVAGEIDEQVLLERSEYFQRWGYDYRLYRPIMNYAREHGMLLVALNVSTELIDAVSRQGLDSLSPEQRNRLPAVIEPIEGEQRERLQAIYDQHPPTVSGSFERFVDVQRVWDAGMAARAADYLRTHPGRRLIVLAGRGHVSHDDGIPARLQRRLPQASPVILLPVDGVDAERQGADYLLLTEERSLPPAGRMGIRLELDDSVSAGSVLPDSAAAHAGIQAEDRIIAVAGRPITGLADLRLALLDKRPGDRVIVTVQRADRADDLALELTLD